MKALTVGTDHRKLISESTFSGTYVLELSDEIDRLKRELTEAKAWAIHNGTLYKSMRPYYEGVPSPFTKMKPSPSSHQFHW